MGSHFCNYVEDDAENGESVLKNTTVMKMIFLEDDMEKRIHKALLPLAEKWSGIELNPTVVYGIRRYERGAWMVAHTDKDGKHAQTNVIILYIFILSQILIL